MKVLRGPNLFTIFKTTIVKKRTRHQNTCQAFPCDIQCRAVETTLCWSVWGMARLLIIGRKKNHKLRNHTFLKRSVYNFLLEMSSSIFNYSQKNLCRCGITPLMPTVMYFAKLSQCWFDPRGYCQIWAILLYAAR